ncbi:FtsB family cell division protein [Nitratireductor basaltis]|uniref:Septum formation initiator n=1 Tax=Nitratireductor basaltis TaxID=472175 RepID=A0A084UAJ1_9HYPH|nr:septum formation initiator family protein [Nitratireductor basaltis]KFB09977.1 Septum formation initiator precursor [Nitratireductor basaltis]
MWTRHHKRRNTGRLIVPMIACVVLAYFSYHAYHGRYGINSKASLEARLELLEAQHQKIVSSRVKLEERLALLQDGSVERDMLDEQARRALNLAQDRELVIFRVQRSN